MSSSFEDKVWKFTEKLADAMLVAGRSQEKRLDSSYNDGKLEDNDYLQQSYKAIQLQQSASEVLEKCRNRNNK